MCLFYEISPLPFQRTSCIIGKVICRCVGIGRRGGLKIHCQRWRAGSSPATGTTWSQSLFCDHVFLCLWQKDVIRPLPCSSFPNRNPLRWARSWCVALWAAFLGNGKISILTASSLRLLILRKTCLLPAKELYSSYPPMGDMRRLKIYGAPSRHTRNYPPSVTSNRTFGSGPQDGGKRTGLQRSFNTACRCKIRN